MPAAYAVGDLTRVRGMVESGTPVAFDLWEAEGFSGGVPAEDPASRRTTGRTSGG